MPASISHHARRAEEIHLSSICLDDSRNLFRMCSQTGNLERKISFSLEGRFACVARQLLQELVENSYVLWTIAPAQGH